MVSRGSKYVTGGCKGHPSLSQTASSNGGVGDMGEGEENESFLEKDIQVRVSCRSSLLLSTSWKGLVLVVCNSSVETAELVHRGGK